MAAPTSGGGGRRDKAGTISDLNQRELTHKDSICACGKTLLCPIIRGVCLFITRIWIGRASVML